MRVMLAIMVMVAAVGTAVGAEEMSVQAMSRALKRGVEHPYLYFTEQEKGAILERIENDPESRDNFRRMQAEARRLLEWPVVDPPPQGKNTRFERNDEYLAIYRGNLGKAFDLAFVYQVTGDEAYARKAYEFANSVCDMPTWTIRAHEFPIIYSRVWPWNVKDDQVLFSFDHVNGDTTREMAAIYDWLYPALDKRQRDRIRGALLEKGITRVRGNYEYHWWATSYRCNWCGVCNSGLGIAALALLEEDPQLVDVITESHNRIGRMYDEIGEGCGWQEGVGYWNYAISTTTYFADALKRLTDGEVNLFEHPRLVKNTVAAPLYMHVPPNRTVPFEDSSDGRVGQSAMYNKLATETGSAEAAWYRENLFGEGTGAFDLVWPRSDVKPALPEQASHLFPTVNWAVLRSDFTSLDKVMVACKAGYNDDPHHGHLDIGQAQVFWQGTGYLSEIKRTPYDEKYFDEERWAYPEARSAGHNVVLVNGEEQRSAKLKDEPWVEGLGGEIDIFEPGEARDYLRMEATGAYPGKELKGWRRHIVLDKPEVVVIVDEVRCAPGAEIEARWHSEATARMREGFALLEGPRGTMALVAVAAAPVELREGRHATLAVQRLAEFAWAPYFGAVVKAPAERTVIATIVAPVKDAAEAKALAASVQLGAEDASGNLTVRYERGGQAHEVAFEGGRGGMRLRKQ